jgi:hypothetical protein
MAPEVGVGLSWGVWLKVGLMVYVAVIEAVDVAVKLCVGGVVRVNVKLGVEVRDAGGVAVPVPVRVAEGEGEGETDGVAVNVRVRVRV